MRGYSLPLARRPQPRRHSRLRYPSRRIATIQRSLPGMTMQQFLLFSPEVAAARAAGRPVVALESTIISHGMPYPQNVQTAREVAQVIRDAGAVPATIAVIGGKIRIGLSAEELEQLATAGNAMKVSR